MIKKMSKSWRPFGYWGLTLNITLGFPYILGGIVLRPEAPWSIGIGLYASLLTTWAVAAGIRQWGKTNGSETKR